MSSPSACKITDSDVQKLIKTSKLIHEADVLFICTGAGMGVASNFGTFRGAAAGVWEPLKKHNLEFTQLSTPSWFHKPDHVANAPLESAGFGYAFWQARFQTYNSTLPHAGYNILKRWIEKKKQSCPLLGGGFWFTSNIDAHALRAGIDPFHIWECHGSIDYMQCVQNCTKGNVSGDNIWKSSDEEWKMDIDPETDCALPPFPTCKHCQGRARPNVMMFYDGEFEDKREEQQAANFNDWERKLLNNTSLKVVVIEIGAGTAIPTVRERSELMVEQLGLDRCALIRMNPEAPGIELNDPQKTNVNKDNKLISVTSPSLECLALLDELISRL